MSGRRSERVAEALREAIAEMLVREIKDPRVGMVTLTSVHMSDDLRHATVYFSCVGDDSVRQRSLSGLRSAAGFIKAQVTRRLKLRFAPAIEFVFDPGLAASERVAALLKETGGSHD